MEGGGRRGDSSSSSSRRLYVVMLPFLGQSHFNVYLQLSRMLATRGVSVIYVSLTSNLESLRPLVQGQGWNHDGLPFYFHDFSIPEAESPLPPGRQNTNKISHDMVPKLFDLLDKMRDPLEILLKELAGFEYYESRGLPPPGRLVLIYDFFMGWSAAVAAKFGVRSFTFHPFSAYMWLCKEAVFWDRDDLLLLLPELADGVETLPLEGYVPSLVRRHMEFTRMADGVLLDTFLEMEPKFIRHLQSGGGGKPFWAVGPVIDFPRKDHKLQRPRDGEILEWLGHQTQGSVVYVSFGTESYISPVQLIELAMGLEASGQPFLWALRPPNTRLEQGSSSAEDWKAELLPEGYEQRVQGRCLIETGWAPQGAILEHGATGAFISHCGWNSCLESMAAGVPIIALPLQVDQPANAMLLAREGKVAVEMKMIDGVAERDEVERAVRCLMSGEDMEVKRRVEAVRNAAVSALSHEGGAAWKNLDSFIEYATE